MHYSPKLVFDDAFLFKAKICLLVTGSFVDTQVCLLFVAIPLFFNIKIISKYHKILCSLPIPLCLNGRTIPMYHTAAWLITIHIIWWSIDSSSYQLWVFNFRIQINDDFKMPKIFSMADVYNIDPTCNKENNPLPSQDPFIFQKQNTQQLSWSAISWP